LKKFILDTSVAMAWCFADEGGKTAEKILDSMQDHTAIVPPLWTYEVTNVLLVAERKKRLSAVDATRYLNLLFQLPIEVDDSLPNATELLRLGRDFKLSSYDAAYLELATRHGCALASLDKDLKKAAKKMGLTLHI